MTSLNMRKGRRIIRTTFSIQELLAFLFLVVLILISIKYCDLHDYRSYYLSYTLEHKMEIEIGYTALAELFYNAGYPFYVYYGLIVSVSLVLIWRFFQKNAIHQFWMMLIFLVYPYINVVQQIRSLIGAAIVLTGLNYILSKEKRILPYIISVVLAMLFHITSVIYLVFIWAVKANYESVRRITTIVLIGGFPLLLLLRYVAYRVFPLISYFSVKYMQYVNTGNILTTATIVDWVIFSTMQVLIVFSTNKRYHSLTEKTQDLLKISYVVFAMSILRGLGNNGYRVALMMYPVPYTMIDNVIVEIQNKTIRMILRIILVVFPVISVFIWWGPYSPRMFNIVKTEMWQVWDYFYR